jgi:hypothetical protein
MMPRLAASNPISAFQESAPPPALADRYVGFRVLWLKVIIRAVFDWVTYRDSLKLDKRKQAENAANWLFNENHLFNGLENVCVMLDLIPVRVRTWAKSMSKDQVTKMEHLERDHDIGKRDRNTDLLLLKIADDLFKEETDEDC